MDIEELAASRIRKARRLRELTQQEAADAVSISQHAWATYENGTRSVSLKMLQKISDALDVPIDYFVNPNFELSVVQVDAEAKKSQARRRRAA